MMNRLLAVLTLLFSLSITPAFAQTVEDGFKARDAGDYEKAKSILIPLAEAGNPKAANTIGRLHSNGWGYVQNKKLACDWFEKSAKAGYVSGQSNFGSCFRSGEGRPLDYQKAIFWKEKAAKQGNVNAQNVLGYLYWKQKDKEKAAYWWQQAESAGSTRARVSMWILGIEHDGKQATLGDIACELVMTGIIGKQWGYCD
jgi:TPR repeat protein